MKKITNIILAIMIIGTQWSCDTEQDVIDNGISNPYFEGTMMDYLRSNDYNWGLTVEMIEKAELVDLFEGNDPAYPEITFFGFTSHSIRHYIYPLEMQDLSQLSKETCRELILKHVVKGTYLKEDMEFRDLNYLINDPNQTGFTELTTEFGNRIWAYKEQLDYAGVPRAGAILMYTYSPENGLNIPMASPNIQPYNGVVHALDYDYVLNRL